jgi:hypothetical protein
MGVLLKILFTLTQLQNIHIEIVDGGSSKTFLYPNQVGKYSHLRLWMGVLLKKLFFTLTKL